MTFEYSPRNYFLHSNDSMVNGHLLIIAENCHINLKDPLLGTGRNLHKVSLFWHSDSSDHFRWAFLFWFFIYFIREEEILPAMVRLNKS